MEITYDNLTDQWTARTRMTVGIVLLILVALLAYKARIIFTPLIIGGIVAYLLYPLAHRVSNGTRLSHGLATALIYLILLGLLIPAGILVAPLLTEQLAGLQAELTEFASSLADAGTEPIRLLGLEVSTAVVVNEVGTALRDFIRTAAAETPELLFGASKTILLVVFTFFFAYYMTADAQKFIRWARSLLPPKLRADVSVLVGEINGIWQAFFRGQIVLALVIALLVTILCTAIGMPQPLLMGLIAGLLEFLVSVGHTIWLIIALIVALVGGSSYLPVSNPVFALIVFGLYILYTQIDLNILIPAIVGGRVHLHPMVVLIGIIVGATVGGVLGVALAAPTIATLRVVGRYVQRHMFDMEPPEEEDSAAPPAPE